MNNFTCIDCGNTLTLHANACPCGWRHQATLKLIRPDYRCVHSVNEQRCKAEGTISRSCTAKGDWYCLNHWHLS